MQELLKILNIYNIKNKLFDVVTNNASNNDTLKEKLDSKIETQRISEINKIMQIDNVIVYLLIIIWFVAIIIRTLF